MLLLENILEDAREALRSDELTHSFGRRGERPFPRRVEHVYPADTRQNVFPDEHDQALSDLNLPGRAFMCKFLSGLLAFDYF